MRQARERAVHRETVNINADRELMQRVREEKGNLSEILDQAMRDFLAKKELERWRDENKPAFESYNAMIEKEGVFSDDIGVI